MAGVPVNPAFRFSAAQADKNRACDDLRRALTNRACAVLTPIKLVSRDHVSEIANRFSELELFRDFFKCDRKSAYKALPVAPAETRLAVIALKSPGGNKFYAFVSRTLLFGSAASVLRYNIFARIVTELFARIFGIPLISFFGDFGDMVPRDSPQWGIGLFSGIR